MKTLLMAQAEVLGAYFSDLREYGTGVPGVCQILGWVFKLANEKHPLGISLWADITNGFNTINRSAIEEGLRDLPPQLQWLSKSFYQFYSQDVQLYFRRGSDGRVILGNTGSMQGDPASGIFFNCGIQRAYNTLREEFPEVLLAKYFDDLNGFIRPGPDGLPLTCQLTEERTRSFPRAYSPTGELEALRPETVPMALALVNRWKYLVKTRCGLTIKTKWGVTSTATPLAQEAYGDPTTNGIPVVGGLLIAGSPVGGGRLRQSRGRPASPRTLWALVRSDSKAEARADPAHPDQTVRRHF
jgi:hypothetical protein